jgi:hypothetical protein
MKPLLLDLTHHTPTALLWTPPACPFPTTHLAAAGRRVLVRFSLRLPRTLRDGGHLLVRCQHHPRFLQPPVRWNQVSEEPHPSSGTAGGTRPCPPDWRAHLLPHRPCAQVRAGPCPLPGLERLPAVHPGWHLPVLQLLLRLQGGPSRQVRRWRAGEGAGSKGCAFL